MQQATEEKKIIKEVTKYQSSDGQEFNTEGEALKHERALKNAGRVEAFLDKNYPRKGEGEKQGPSRAIAKTAVEAFLEGDF